MHAPAVIRMPAVVSIVVAAAAPAFAQLTSELVVSGLSRPVAVVAHPTLADVSLIVEQGGRIRVLRDGALAGDYLDVTAVITSDGERGLLGLAFAPDFATSRRAFVSFTNLSGHTVIARYRQPAGDVVALDPASRFDLQWPGGDRFLVQPFSNHNGGHLAFGPDGYLYVGLGDGGSGNDPLHLAQDRTTPLGKMLRLDVAVPDSDAEGYDVPPDNPFVDLAGTLPEIWAFGLRNPWRYSFDDPSRGGTGALVIGDVGQNRWEEVNYEPAGRGGRNYGWRNREGAHDNVTSLPPAFLPLTDPVWEYSHDDGRSITGGVVYRGSALGSAYRGRYFFADFVLGRVWSIALTVDAAGAATASNLLEHTAELGAAAAAPSSFGVDAGGELLIVSYSGSVHRIGSTVPRDPGNLIQNGGFEGGRGPDGMPAGWSRRAAPTPDDIVVDTADGVLGFRRPAGSTEAVVFQNTGVALPAGTTLLATFAIGNSDQAPRDLRVLIHDEDFSEVIVCAFPLQPVQPLRSHVMRVETTEAWTGAAVSFVADTPGGSGWYQLDDVTMRVGSGAIAPGPPARRAPVEGAVCARRAVRRAPGG